MLTTSLPLSSDTSESGLVSPPFLTAFEMNALGIYALPTHASKRLAGSWSAVGAAMVHKKAIMHRMLDARLSHANGAITDLCDAHSR